MPCDPAGDPEEALSLFAKKRKPSGQIFKKSISIDTNGEEGDVFGLGKKPLEIMEASAGPSSLDYAYTNTKIAEREGEELEAKSNVKLEALEHSRRLAESGTLDTIYRGTANRQQFILQKDTTKANAGSEKSRIAGPKQGPSNLRTTCRFDYRPDRCKDYAETGFCGFGDSCIFLHDRSEYKSSWQLDREWDAAQKAEQAKETNADHMVKMTDDKELKVTACAACRGPLKCPVQTRCKHVFCELCVLQKKKCPTCNEILNGSFIPYKIK